MRKLKNLNRAQVRKLAHGLAKKYSNKSIAIGLTGQLGGGKTAFTKDFARTLGINRIKSPTFVVGSIYPIKLGALYHFDFYRLEQQTQLKALELDEIIKSRSRVIIIEWVDKFPKIAKLCDLIINFEISGKNLRNVTIS